MTDTGPEWGLALDLGDHWYPLPLDRDPAEFGAHVAEALVADAEAVNGAPMTPEVAEAIAEEFTVLTGNAQRTGAFATSLYRPLYDAPSVAVLEAHVNAGDPGTPIRTWVERAHGDLGVNHELSNVVLPVGGAVRLWQLSGDSAPGGDAVLVETVAHFFEAPGGDIVRLALSWTAPAFSQELRELADSIAQDVAFQ
ncbi:MAG: hypothetical protein ABWX74_15415 [Aeromicrobium sp.]